MLVHYFSKTEPFHRYFWRIFSMFFLEILITGIENFKVVFFKNSSIWLFLKIPFHIYKIIFTVKTILTEIFWKEKNNIVCESVRLSLTLDTILNKVQIKKVTTLGKYNVLQTVKKKILVIVCKSYAESIYQSYCNTFEIYVPTEKDRRQQSVLI